MPRLRCRLFTRAEALSFFRNRLKSRSGHGGASTSGEQREKDGKQSLPLVIAVKLASAHGSMIAGALRLGVLLLVAVTMLRVFDGGKATRRLGRCLGSRPAFAKNCGRSAAGRL
jgi:hypothetical protein